MDTTNSSQPLRNDSNVPDTAGDAAAVDDSVDAQAFELGPPVAATEKTNSSVSQMQNKLQERLELVEAQASTAMSAEALGSPEHEDGLNASNDNSLQQAPATALPARSVSDAGASVKNLRALWGSRETTATNIKTSNALPRTI